MQVTGVSLFANTGWTCPGCGRCFSPSTAMCWFCPARTTYQPNFTITSTDIPVAEYTPREGEVWQPATQTVTGVAPLTVGESGVAPLTVGHYPTGDKDPEGCF